MSTNKAIVIGVVILAVIVALMMGGGIIGQRGTATEAENGIITQRQACAVIVDASFNQIVGTLKIQDTFFEQMRGIFEALVSGEPGVDSNGFLAIMQANAVASGTDWTAISLEAIRVYNAALEQVSGCHQKLADRQRAYADILGVPQGMALGQGNGTFPNAWYAGINHLPRRLASGAPNSPNRDLDGDGVLTVFDYPAVVVSGLTRDAYEDGNLPDLFPEPTPEQ